MIETSAARVPPSAHWLPQDGIDPVRVVRILPIFDRCSEDLLPAWFAKGPKSLSVHPGRLAPAFEFRLPAKPDRRVRPRFFAVSTLIDIRWDHHKTPVAPRRGHPDKWPYGHLPS